MITKNQIRDHKKYFIEKGDEGFNPKRNQHIVNDTIKKYELMRRNKMYDYINALGERTQAIAFYLKSLIGSGKPVEKYFGKRWLAYLRGQRIRQILQQKYTGPIRELRNKRLYLPGD